jgi:hypothetical protein
MSSGRETKRIFDAGYARIRQIFLSGKMANLKSGEVVYTSGIAPLYYKAKEQNLKFSSLKLANIKDNEMSTATDALSHNSYADQIELVTNYIILNTRPSYPNDIISYIYEKTKIKPDQISNILKILHNHKYKDHIHEMLELVFKKLSINSKNEICSKTFLDTLVKQYFISSKHTEEIVNLKKICDKLLEDILLHEYKPPTDYNSFNDSNKSQFRNLIIYGLCYNLQHFMCYSNHG